MTREALSKKSRVEGITENSAFRRANHLFMGALLTGFFFIVLCFVWLTSITILGYYGELAID